MHIKFKNQDPGPSNWALHLRNAVVHKTVTVPPLTDFALNVKTFTDYEFFDSCCVFFFFNT